jgi:3-aminobutyryl-CoA ammonia-lyase
MLDQDARRPGDVVDSSRILELFADVAAELSQRTFGALGQLRAYEAVEFVAPVHPGDVLEVEAETLSSNPSSLTIRLEARKTGAASDAPQLVAYARGTWIAGA